MPQLLSILPAAIEPTHYLYNRLLMIPGGSHLFIILVSTRYSLPPRPPYSPPFVVVVVVVVFFLFTGFSLTVLHSIHRSRADTVTFYPQVSR